MGRAPSASTPVSLSLRAPSWTIRAKSMATKKKTPVRQPTRKPERRLTRAALIDLYGARQYLRLDTIKETGLRMPVEVYFKDPDVAARHEMTGIDAEFTTPWEPGLADGPTSARFVVVDYDSTNNILTAPAIWDRAANCYVAPDRKTVLDAKTKELYQYHQLSVWAIAQNTLEFFES